MEFKPHTKSAYVVCYATNFDRFDLVLTGDPAQIRPKPFLQYGGYLRPPIFSTENAVEVRARIGHADHSAVPAGLGQCKTSFPKIEILGYFHSIPSGYGPENPSGIARGRLAVLWRCQYTPWKPYGFFFQHKREGNLNPAIELQVCTERFIWARS